MKGSVKIMRSYDYCHFEVILSSDEDMTSGQIDEMRKEAQRMVDKSVHQYRVAKTNVQYTKYNSSCRKRLEHDVKVIKENFPKSEWTEEQKAIVRALEDFQYYDYQDDWENQEY